MSELVVEPIPVVSLESLSPTSVSVGPSSFLCAVCRVTQREMYNNGLFIIAPCIGDNGVVRRAVNHPVLWLCHQCGSSAPRMVRADCWFITTTPQAHHPFIVRVSMHLASQKTKDGRDIALLARRAMDFEGPFTWRLVGPHEAAIAYYEAVATMVVMTHGD